MKTNMEITLRNPDEQSLMIKSFLERSKSVSDLRERIQDCKETEDCYIADNGAGGYSIWQKFGVTDERLMWSIDVII